MFLVNKNSIELATKLAMLRVKKLHQLLKVSIEFKGVQKLHQCLVAELVLLLHGGEEDQQEGADITILPVIQ